MIHDQHEQAAQGTPFHYTHDTDPDTPHYATNGEAAGAGELSADGVPLAAIAREIGTPCYVYAVDWARQRLRDVRNAFPEAEIHYSLKANANLALVAALHAAGAGADCVSGG